jgi:osmotically-inducible protein OsmY
MRSVIARVLGVASDIEVRLPSVDEGSDPDIARDAIAQIKCELPTPWEKIRVVANKGRLTLEGEVEWNYQRERAEQAVRHVSNLIQFKHRIAATEIKRKIEYA